MKVVVSGGAGFIGSHVVDALVAGGHEVVVLDSRPPQHPNAGASYVAGDVTDVECWSRILEGVDAVSHQAARVGLGVRFADVGDYVRDNDLGTAALLWALDQRRFGGRLVVASSMVVYGESPSRCARCGPVRPDLRSAERLARGEYEPVCPSCGGHVDPEPVTEEAATDPRNVYAATKLHQEHLAECWARQSDGTVVSLRYHNVYGPRSPAGNPYSGVASLFLSALRSGGTPRVFEDGMQLRDFVHVRDVARANVAALLAPHGVSGPFNIASGRPRTVLDLARSLCAAVGSTGDVPEVTGEWRLGDVRHVTASPRRAAEVLGFSAEVSFEEGMTELGAAPALAS